MLLDRCLWELIPAVTPTAAVGFQSLAWDGILTEVDMGVKYQQTYGTMQIVVTLYPVTSEGASRQPYYSVVCAVVLGGGGCSGSLWRKGGLVLLLVM